MALQKNGSNARRRSSGVGRQNAALSRLVSATPPCSWSINNASAPLKTSCQRKPSTVMRKTFSVLVDAELAARGGRPDRETRQKSSSLSRKNSVRRTLALTPILSPQEREKYSSASKWFPFND